MSKNLRFIRTRKGTIRGVAGWFWVELSQEGKELFRSTVFYDPFPTQDKAIRFAREFYEEKSVVFDEHLY